jgi:arabinofuranan 3-O-arabinosyltransferase
MDGIATTQKAPAFRFKPIALWVLLAAFTVYCIPVAGLVDRGVLGVDFAPMWAGAKAAIAHPEKIYDFRYITELQGWPMGPDRIRPFIYPPSALVLFAPLALIPYGIAQAIWGVATGSFFLWGARRVGAPWWLASFPVIWLVAICGQSTFLIGGLVMTALTLPRRSVLAGVLLGVAAAVKPQMLLFLPLALLAEGRWRTIVSAGVTGFALCVFSAAVWGPGTWIEWLSAVHRFQTEVVFDNPALVADAITPYAWLQARGVPGAWAYLLAPVAAGIVWTTFRRSQDVADRLIAVFAAAIMVSPYAMHYEAALLAPAVAAYVARLDARGWYAYAVAAFFFAVGMVWGVTTLAMALSLPMLAQLSRRRTSVAIA